MDAVSVSGDTERSGKSWRPKANERAFLIFESEFFLARRSGLKASPLRDSFHDSRLHESKPALDTKGVEHVLGRAESIADGDELGEAIQLLGSLAELGAEASHDRIRNKAVFLYRRNHAIGRHAVTKLLPARPFLRQGR